MTDCALPQDVQWVITALTKVICDFNLHEAEEHAVAAKKCPVDFHRLTLEKILVAPSLTDVLWTGGYEQFKDHLLAIMVHHDLAVPVRSTHNIQEYLIPSLTTSIASNILASPTPASAPTTLGKSCYFHIQANPLGHLPDDPKPNPVLAYDELGANCLLERDFNILVSEWAKASPHATLSAISRGCVRLAGPQGEGRLTIRAEMDCVQFDYDGEDFPGELMKLRNLFQAPGDRFRHTLVPIPHRPHRFAVLEEVEARLGCSLEPAIGWRSSGRAGQIRVDHHVLPAQALTAMFKPWLRSEVLFCDVLLSGNNPEKCHVLTRVLADCMAGDGVVGTTGVRESLILGAHMGVMVMDGLDGRRNSLDRHLLVEWLLMLEQSKMDTASFTLVPVFGPNWKREEFSGIVLDPGVWEQVLRRVKEVLQENKLPTINTTLKTKSGSRVG